VSNVEGGWTSSIEEDIKNKGKIVEENDKHI
jgi:hypothetical protein